MGYVCEYALGEMLKSPTTQKAEFIEKIIFFNLDYKVAFIVCCRNSLGEFQILSLLLRTNFASRCIYIQLRVPKAHALAQFVRCEPFFLFSRKC